MGQILRAILPTLLFLILQTASCINQADFGPLNPCDPLYQGTEPCGPDQRDSQIPVQEIPEERDGTIQDDPYQHQDSGPQPHPPCLDHHHTIQPGWCYIDHNCHPEGTTEPLESCQICDPAQSKEEWTNKPDGTNCTIHQKHKTETTGQCREGHCIPGGCQCGLTGFCCDGCDPINTGEECFQSTQECTTYQCTEQGHCQLQIIEGWCLTEENQCINTQYSPDHCGECENQCPPGNICAQGHCQPDCPPYLTPCTDQCVNLQTDPNHCGQCHRECTTSQTCLEGDCVLDCAPGQTPCGHTCVNTDQDPNHCGTCSHPCGPNQECINGQCLIRVKNITLNTDRVDLGIGETYQLTAQIHPENATNQNINWISQVQRVATVTEEGLVTGVDTGETQIQATTEDGRHTATATVTVRRAVTKVTLNHTHLSLPIGAQGNLTATVHPPDADDPTVTWTTTNPNIAQVDQNGRITTQNFGETTITVTTTDGGRTAHCQVSVVDVPVTGVTVTPPTLTINRGDTATLTAQVEPNHATVRTVLWTTDAPQVVQVSNGQITAVSGGQATITATTFDGGHRDTCLVTSRIPATGLEITTNRLWIAPGTTEQMIGTISPPDATNQTITWQSDHPHIAAVDQDTGLVTGLTIGDTHITGTTGDGGFTDRVEIKVGIPTTGLTVTPDTLHLLPGESHQMTATVQPPQASYREITWHTSDPTVATVDQNGLVTGLTLGRATITATTVKEGIQAKCTLTVGVFVTHVTLTPPSLALVPGQAGQLTALVEPPEATINQVTWTSDSPAVATVEQDTGLVTAVSPGRATVTATTVDGGKTAAAPITVATPGTLAWAASFGGDGAAMAASMALDPEGNIWLGGGFNSDQIELGGDLLINQGNLDIFLAKFSPDGEHIWSAGFGGTGNEHISSLVVNNQGEVYITGAVGSPEISFGGETITVDTNSNLFLAKYAPDGEHIWSHIYGGNHIDKGEALALDPEGNLYLAGYFSSTHLYLGEIPLSTYGSHDGFLAKFSPEGEHLWSLGLGNQNNDMATAVTTDQAGDVYVAGHFSSHFINLGGGSLVRKGPTSIFLAKFSGDGNHLWSEVYGGQVTEKPSSLATDSMGNLYMTGIYYSPVVNFGGQNLTSRGGCRIFLVKFTGEGKHIWSRGFDGDQMDESISTTIDSLDNVYVVGGYRTNYLSFGGAPLQNRGSKNMFFAKFDPNGEHLQSAGFGGSLNDWADAIQVTKEGSIYLTGSYTSSEVEVLGEIITNQGSQNFILMKIW